MDFKTYRSVFSMVVQPSDTVASVMTKLVHTVEASDRVKVVLAKMVEKDIGSIVVVKGGKPIGIVTERDIVKRMIRDESMMRQPFLFVMRAEEIMSRPLITVPSDATIWDAVRVMVKNKIRRLVVVEASRMVGIVTERDLLRWVVRVAYEPDIPEDIRDIVVKGY